MKKLLSLLMLSAVALTAKATHLMGGDLTAHYDSAANGYIVKLTHYRDTMGVPMYTNTMIEVYQYDPVTTTYTFLQTLHIPLNTALSTALLPSFPYGVEVGVYDDTITLAPGRYRLMSTECCRNGAILNMATPLNESMMLFTELDVDVNNNSTPGFMAMPVAYFPVNQPATYNPLPYDPDGDSIAWALNTPISTFSTVTFQMDTVDGFVSPSADVSGPFTMNPLTGEITWTPDTVGNFVQSFEVNEYKNGVAVGKIIRDMQYVVIPSGSNVSPYFQMVTPYNSNTSQGYQYVYYHAGQQLSFEIKGADVNSNNTLVMEAYSPAFEMANPATFTTTTAGNEVIGTFNWTPPAGYNKDMLAVFRVKDGQFSNDFTLVMKNGATSVAGVAGSLNSITVYPNPAQKRINIAMELDRDIHADVALYSVTGQKVKDVYAGKLMKGSTQLSEEVSVAPGVYHLIVRENGSLVKSVAITIQ